MSSSCNILYEDDYIIAVNKSNKELIQKDITGDLPLDDIVKEYLKNNNKKSDVFLGIVHRLDRPASGAVIFAKTRNILSRLNKMLHEGEIKKKYWAIVKNKPQKEEDKLVNYIIKNQKQNKSYCYDEPLLKSREAILE
jgi:23S rRNA pseudouridine1911/1915/1917 synthase